MKSIIQGKRKRSNIPKSSYPDVHKPGISPNKKKLKTAAATDPYFKKRKNPNAKI